MPGAIVMAIDLSSFELIDIPPGMHQSSFDEVIYLAYKMGASDITIQSNDYIVFSIVDQQTRISRRTLQQAEINSIVSFVYGSNGVAMLSQGVALNPPRYEIMPSRGERIGFRVNITPTRVDGNDTAISITMRVLPKNPPTIFEIGVQDEIVRGALPRNGLVVIAGVTSSGKSTTIAGIIRYAYELKKHNTVTRAGRKTITFEAPIEYVFDGINSIAPKISQTEITQSGYGLKTWSDAVSAAMRKAASIILIGECSSGDTIDGCISMALTGHCTLTTVHADTVSVAFRRMVAMAAEIGGGNAAVTERLLGSLSMIIVQTLCPKIGGGRVALREWIVFPKSLKDRLFELPTSAIANEIQREVMRRGTSMGHSAQRMYQRGEITLSDACAFSGLSKAELTGLVVDESMYVEFKGDDDATA